MNLTSKDFIPSQYVGYGVKPKSGSVNIRQFPGTKEVVISKINAGEVKGTVRSLYFKKVDGYSWYYISFRGDDKKATNGFVATDVISVVKPKDVTPSAPSSSGESDEEKAKKLMNDVIQRDIIIHNRLVTAYAVFKSLDKNGKNVDAQMKVLNALVLRLGDRQQKIKDIEKRQEAVNTFQFGPIKVNMKEAYDALRKKLGLGAAPVVAIPAVVAFAVVAIGSVALTVYILNVLKPAYDEQTVDLDLSKKFGDYWKTLPDSPEKEEAMKDVEKQIDDAYNTGKSDGASSSTWAWIKTAGIVIASVWGFTKLLDMSENWRSRKNAGLKKA